MPGLGPWPVLGLMLGLGVLAWVISKASVRTTAWVEAYSAGVKSYGVG